MRRYHEVPIRSRSDSADSTPRADVSIFQLLPVPLSDDWERLDAEAKSSTVAYFEGGYKSDKVKILVWKGIEEAFSISKDGEIYTLGDGEFPDDPDHEAQGWTFEGEPETYLAYERPFLVEVIPKGGTEMINSVRAGKMEAVEFAWNNLPKPARTRDKPYGNHLEQSSSQ